MVVKQAEDRINRLFGREYGVARASHKSTANWPQRWGVCQ
jgi:hypothetical protein